MDSSSLTEALLRLLGQISAGIGRSGKLPWRNQDKPTLRRILDHIISHTQILSCCHQFISDDDREPARQLIADLKMVEDHVSILDIRLFLEKKRSFLPDPADCYANLASIHGRFWYMSLEDVEMAWVMPFLQHLQEVFQVPKLNHPRNVVVAKFMDFLLQLLSGKPNLFDFEANLVITELRSFITIVQDTPFLTAENNGQVHTLLTQFETLANEAGRLVHSFLFSPLPPPLKKLDELLLEPITLLKSNVIQFINSPSFMMNTPNTLHFAMSSVFIVDSFLYDLEDLMNRQDDSILEVKDDVEKLHCSLKYSWSWLNKHSDKTYEVKEIVSLAFAAEYLINYFLCGDVAAWYLTHRLPSIIHNVELLGTRLQEMLMENHNVDRVRKVGDDFGERLSLQTGINSGVDDTVDGFKYEELIVLDTMIGFEDEELKILSELVGGGEGLKIISIIGMPGLGKTTLAKKMYNHRAVRDKFDRISWCIVSQEYKRKMLLVDILKGLDSQAEKATTAAEREDEVGLRIHKTLKGRRYFIVVDDIWELSAWEDIKRYLPDEQNGSRILFTSRNKEVADQCNSSIHALPLLSPEQCWELLKMKVFNSESCPSNLQHIGQKIASKCNGLPLVVVVVAGILSTMKKDLRAWEDVRQTFESYMSYEGGAVGKSLELSYMYLPHHLKPCFLYFGRCREDEQIGVKKVMQLWIAEGFVLPNKEKRAEDIAKEYLQQLIDKNLLIVVEKNYDGQAKVCGMHDLLRDMCLKIAKDENFLKVADGDISFCNHQVHRLICHSFARLLPYAKYMRSFACPFLWVSHLNLGPMKVLRVFDAIGSTLDDLIGIQTPVSMRYWAAMRHVPKSGGRFSSLEFLIIGGPLHIFSSDLDAMPKLRYLSASKVFVSINSNIPRTYKLEYISTFRISLQEHQHWLKFSPHIRKLKCEYYDSKLFNYNFGSFTQLESLSLTRIREVSGIKFLPNIKKLSLIDCVLFWKQMSTIGALPNLEVLKIDALRNCGEEWETRDDEFQKLKYLRLRRIYELVEWDVSSWEHFPVLQHLIITDCRNLKEIPSEIGNIPTLQLISVSQQCKPSLKESLVKIEEQLKEEGNEDVTILKDHIYVEGQDNNTMLRDAAMTRLMWTAMTTMLGNN